MIALCFLVVEFFYMVINKFEELICWQKAQDFAVGIYSKFRDSKDWGFRDQICKAVVSISNNIAEGFDRSSDAEFTRFLYYALGSASETKSMLYLARKLDYIVEVETAGLIQQADEVSKIIRGLIKSLNKS